MIKAVIFDLDGTLLDSLYDLYVTMNKMLMQCGFPPREDIEYHRLAVGGGAKNYIYDALPDDAKKTQELIDDCFAVFTDLYDEKAQANTKPYEGIYRVLDFLKQQNISINVLSNKPDAPTKALVERWFSDYPIDCAFGDRVGFKRKPAPDSALEIAETIGISPEEIAFIGDSEADMQTGKNAGMVSVGVLWGYRKQEELIANGADVLVETPTDIITFIKDYNL